MPARGSARSTSVVGHTKTKSWLIPQPVGYRLANQKRCKNRPKKRKLAETGSVVEAQSCRFSKRGQLLDPWLDVALPPLFLRPFLQAPEPQKAFELSVPKGRSH